MVTTTGAERATTPDGVHRAWQALLDQGYALVRDTELGLDESLRHHLGSRYFDDAVLEADHAEVHKDRDRARDVVRYEWHDEERISLAEHHTVTINNRSGFVGSRDHSRVEVLTDPVASRWVETALSLVPPAQRQSVGTFGINFFRTRTTVVSGPHHDNEDFCLVYVVDKEGDGAETRLHDPADPDRILFRHTLEPGDMLIFRDRAYLHDVSPLLDGPATPCRRDAIVCTVNYADTYPA